MLSFTQVTRYIFRQKNLSIATMCWLSVGHMFSFPSSPQGDQGESGETGSDGRPGGKVNALMIIALNRFPISLDRFIHSLSPILGKM